MTTSAYNFVKVEQVLIAGQWGRFVFVGDRRFRESSVLLESLHKGSFDQALIAYLAWLQAQCPEGQEAHALSHHRRPVRDTGTPLNSVR